MQQSNPSQVSLPGISRELESPATFTNLTITHSIQSDVSTGKDPDFWRRFSVAIHRDEEQARQPMNENSKRESWLARQRKKTRRSKILGLLIALSIVLLACGAGIAFWLLSKNDWFRNKTSQSNDTQS